MGVILIKSGYSSKKNLNLWKINSHIDYDLTIEIISVKIFHEGKWKSHLCLDYDKMTIERLVASLRE